MGKKDNQSSNSIKLAKALAINYWNSSLSTNNLDHISSELRKKETHPSLDSVFVKDFIKNRNGDVNFSPLGFTRNILIIGAGASKNENKPLLLADEIIKTAYNELGIFEILIGSTIKESEENEESKKSKENEESKKPVWWKCKELKIKLEELIEQKQNVDDSKPRIHLIKKFISHSFHYLGQVIDYDMKLGELINELKFEGAIVVALEFVDKYDFNKFLIEKLHHKYIPSLFYEMVSHLFKHRFIDVIINLNFDEMLDNAIEDELESGEYIRIYNDSTCTKFGNTLVDGRLRKPLYIKPHGTISDIDSLRYSKSHYIDISPSITRVLEKVFSGQVTIKNDAKHIKQFNIITAGFGLGDPDINAVIGSNLLKNGSDYRTSIHIFDFNPEGALRTMYDQLCQQEKFKEHNNIAILDEIKIRLESISPKFSFDESFGENKLENGKTIAFEYEKLINSKLSQKTNVHLYATNEKESLGIRFLKLYSEIQKWFKPPFIPTNPSRHLWNCAIFNKSYFSKDKDKSTLLYDRAKVNILFDFYKFNGLVPNHLVYADRSGKYYKLYLSQRPTNPISLTEYVMKAFNLGKNNPVKSKEMYLEHEKFYKSCFDLKTSKSARESAIFTIKKVKTVIYNSLKEINCELDLNKNLNSFTKITEPFKEIIKTVPFGTSHELSPIYLDNKHFRFKPFKSRHIINTNLCLTWRFYYFATKCVDWNKLYIVGKTGSAFFNLDKYQEKENGKKTHLFKLISRVKNPIKEVNIYHLHEIPVQFKKNSNDKVDYSNPISLKKKYEKCSDCKNYTENCKKCNELKKIKFHKLKDYFGHHKIALFKKDDELKHVIYFFNPTNKSRINPIWFSVQDDEKNKTSYNLANLKIIDDLFKNTL